MKTNSMSWIALVPLLLLGTGCPKTVPASTTDEVPPKVGLLAASHGTLKSVESGGSPASMVVRAGSEIGVLAATSDPLGARSATLEVVSGGRYRDPQGNLVATATHENQLVDGNTRDAAYVGGSVIPDSPSATVVIRASGADWAGNAMTSPTITIEQQPPPVARISASQASIDRGASVTLTYESEHASEVKLDGVVQPTLSGTRVVSPAMTTTYQLEARNAVGRDQAEVTVQVVQPPSAPRIDTFRAGAATATLGQSVTLTWATTNATSVSITDNGASVVNGANPDGNRSVTLDSVGDHTFRLTATGPGGTDVATTTVSVTAPPPPEPTCFRTNCLGNFLCFGRMLIDNTGSLWEMDLRAFTSSGRITTIRNRTGMTIVLEVGNTTTSLASGVTSTEYDDVRVNSLYTALVAHAPASTPTHIDIEVCYE